MSSESSEKVFCSKFKEELPKLKKAPFSGELGKEVVAKVSERAWRLWSEDVMIKVINEYRLNLTDPQDYEKLLDQMKLFLGLGDNESEALEVGVPRE